MKNPFTLVTPPGITAKRAMEKEADAAFAKIMLASEAPKTTIVGDLVQKMDRTYRSYTERADRLTASIADQQEQLRQTRVTIAAIEAAMTTLADEVVLTPDERSAAKAAADAQFDEAVGGLFKQEIVNSPEFQKWLDEAQRGVRMVRRGER